MTHASLKSLGNADQMQLHIKNNKNFRWCSWVTFHFKFGMYQYYGPCPKKKYEWKSSLLASHVLFQALPGTSVFVVSPIHFVTV